MESGKKDKRNKKLVDYFNRCDCTGLFQKKILTGAVFLLAPSANMLGRRRYPVFCMKWQHAVVLESICETNSILSLLPAKRRGLLKPLLTCSPLLCFYFLLEENFLSPNLFLLFTPWDNVCEIVRSLVL